MKKIDKLKARAERFADEDEVMPSTTITNLENKVSQLRSFEKPEEIKRSAVITEDSLYLFGTDFMSTGDIKDYMGIQFPDIFVTWINDSSCTIKFDSNE